MTETNGAAHKLEPYQVHTHCEPSEGPALLRKIREEFDATYESELAEMGLRAVGEVREFCGDDGFCFTVSVEVDVEPIE